VPRALVEFEADRDAEAVAQRRGEQARAGGGADEGEFRQLDLHRAGGRAFADDEVELVVLHRRIEDLFHRRVEAVDLVDEQDVALLQIGKLRRQIAGLGDHRAGGRAEIDAEFAGDDLRQRRLAEARRADEQDVIEGLAGLLGGLDEDLHVGARRPLPDELGEAQGADRLVGVVRPALGAQQGLAGLGGLVFAHGGLAGRRPNGTRKTPAAPSPRGETAGGGASREGFQPRVLHILHARTTAAEQSAPERLACFGTRRGRGGERVGNQPRR
jgi:hypothetical protein